MLREYLISFPMFGETFVIDPPTSFTVFGFPLYYYGLIIAGGFFLAMIYAMKISREFGLTQDNIIDMLLFAVPLAIVGARIYYVACQWQDYAGDLMSVFNLRQGGIAIYGAVIGAVIGAAIACRWRKISIGAMLDIGSLGLLIGQGVGRWANFINREAFGSETDVLWRMGLTNPNTIKTVYVHPTFLYESVWNLLGFLLLHIFSKKGKRQFDGQFFAMYVAWYGFGRMFIEGLRTDSLFIPGTPIRISQLLAALSFVGAMLFLIYMLRRPYEPQKLWVNSAPALLSANGAPADETTAETEEIETSETEDDMSPEQETDAPEE